MKNKEKFYRLHEELNDIRERQLVLSKAKCRIYNTNCSVAEEQTELLERKEIIESLLLNLLKDVNN